MYSSINLVVAISIELLFYTTGDHVALDPIIPCRKCRNCLSGKYNICLEHIVKGCWIDGYLQRFVVMSESNCHV